MHPDVKIIHFTLNNPVFVLRVRSWKNGLGLFCEDGQINGCNKYENCSIYAAFSILLYIYINPIISACSIYQFKVNRLA